MPWVNQVCSSVCKSLRVVLIPYIHLPPCSSWVNTSLLLNNARPKFHVNLVAWLHAWGRASCTWIELLSRAFPLLSFSFVFISTEVHSIFEFLLSHHYHNPIIINLKSKLYIASSGLFHGVLNFWVYDVKDLGSWSCADPDLGRLWHFTVTWQDFEEMMVNA